MPDACPQHPTENVEQFCVDSLKPGEAVMVRGRRIDPKGKPTDDTFYITVMMTNQFYFDQGHPFPEITKIRGIAVCSSDPKLLLSCGPRLANWVGNEIAVGQGWNAFTHSGRKMHVDEITVTYS